MARHVFAYVLHKSGTADDTALELAAASAAIDTAVTVTAIAAGNGPDLDKVCQGIAGFFDEVWKIDHQDLVHVNAEVLRPALVKLIPENAVFLMPHEHFGMDLAPGLSIKLGFAYLPDAIRFEGIESNRLTAVREEYAGATCTHVGCDISRGAVITVRPGAFKPEKIPRAGKIIDKTGDIFGKGLPAPRRRFVEVIEAETGDVDITRSEVLVSVGRGIEEQENLEIVEALAEAIGADLSCSRPIVDAKWLDKSRQVGTSGKTVKPRVYIALGISGSFQHLGGIKGTPFMVAINKNPKAPIFQSADVGVVADILEFIPELTEKIKEMKG
jgi:electron transfer flavoprotein alpha subunit